MKKAQEGHVRSLLFPAVSQWQQSRNSEKDRQASVFRGVPLDIDMVLKGGLMEFGLLL